MTSKYEYDDPMKQEIARCLRGLFPPGIHLRPATKHEDFGGVDVRWIVAHDVPLQLRVRKDRPAYASDIDITFRHTEPAMIAARTYAPLAVFMWTVRGQIKAAKLVDVYHLAAHLDPPLRDRQIQLNWDEESGFLSITIAELHQAGALLRIYDGTVWATACLGGEARLNRILEEWHRSEAV